MSKFRLSLLPAGAFLALAGFMALAAPALAEDAASAPPPRHDSTMTQDPVEAMITKLHAQLKITPAQEDAFNALAQTMRDNRAAHDALVTEKKKAEATQSALDDLQTYAQITQAHADGVKKLADTFAVLYDSLSPKQKIAADKAFRTYKRQMMRHVHQAAPASSAPAQ